MNITAIAYGYDVMHECNARFIGAYFSQLQQRTEFKSNRIASKTSLKQNFNIFSFLGILHKSLLNTITAPVSLAVFIYCLCPNVSRFETNYRYGFEHLQSNGIIFVCIFVDFELHFLGKYLNGYNNV